MSLWHVRLVKKCAGTGDLHRSGSRCFPGHEVLSHEGKIRSKCKIDQWTSAEKFVNRFQISHCKKPHLSGFGIVSKR